jgi:hypothetical protein
VAPGTVGRCEAEVLAQFSNRAAVAVFGAERFDEQEDFLLAFRGRSSF